MDTTKTDPKMALVRLDDAKYGAGPGTVVRQDATFEDWKTLAHDRDGARIRDLRLWVGDLPVGTRVMMRQL